MKEILDSVQETIKNRLTNSLYGTFIISWLIFHWNFVFSFFALDDEKILKVTGLLKNEYLLQRYFDFHSPYFWISWIMPFILTYIIIWRLPKWILLKAYEETDKHETDKNLIKISNQIKIEKEQARLQEQTTKKVTEVAKRVLEEKKIKDTDPTIKWVEEFDDFRNKPIFYEFPAVIRSIYENQGYTSYGPSNTRISTNMLAYLDTNNLTKNIGSHQIELTPKGKFFVKKYNENLSQT